jgi:hypothetical protein
MAIATTASTTAPPASRSPSARRTSSRIMPPVSGCGVGHELKGRLTSGRQFPALHSPARP